MVIDVQGTSSNTTKEIFLPTWILLSFNSFNIPSPKILFVAKIAVGGSFKLSNSRVAICPLSPIKVRFLIYWFFIFTFKSLWAKQ